MQSRRKWLYGVANLFRFVAALFAKVLISRLVSHRKSGKLVASHKQTQRLNSAILPFLTLFLKSVRI